MKDITKSQPELDSLWRRYQDNFPRHLVSVAHHVQSGTISALARDYGHHDLRLNFEPYISMLGKRGARLSEVAAALGISRQAVNQTINLIEAAGYVRRERDPNDGRAKRVVLTDRGIALRRDNTRVTQRYQKQVIAICGPKAILQAVALLHRLCLGLDLELPPSGSPGEVTPVGEMMGALLPRISDHITARLMQLTAQRGHTAIRESFDQVLFHVGPGGGRIQHIAAINGVSKQAISNIALELEALGYVDRERDPNDARQLILQFTARGRALMLDSAASIDELGLEFTRILGAAALATLQETLGTLYHALHLGKEGSGIKGQQDIHVLARQLQQQLGTRGALALGRLLLSCADKESP